MFDDDPSPQKKCREDFLSSGAAGKQQRKQKMNFFFLFWRENFLPSNSFQNAMMMIIFDL
jgi:hypothetical protein